MAEEIWHHGVKGMHWGIRRTPAQLGHRPGGGSKSEGKPKVEPHDDYKKAHDSKSVKTMSDAELRARLNRLNMEKQYSQMNPNRVQRGRNTLNTAIKVAGTVAAASTTAITLKNNWNTISGWFGKGGLTDMREAVRNMSDSELAGFIKRAKLEDSYLKLLNR